MRVKIYDYNHNDTKGEAFRAECDLAECFDPGDPEVCIARAELQKVGRYWTGGGAAPLVLLMIVRD